ncbi:unnamed protein product [Heligmosomoides polygyrus]|uniref:G_PROTEIN_RECEP_F1_2 domain-containing protein n=1 Tax=Heligmosomoides polygyrus TaxID=6339 RepID=A0A3P8BWF3_HELPZ|nr:unnamed protein product [Heligmosomoides polygyrus]
MDVSIFMGIVCLVVVCGNFFVLYALVSQPSLHTTTNFLVLSLTISDLLLGIAIIPFAIIQEHNKDWLFGNVGCRLWLTADVWLSTASIYNLLAISFDRYMAVRQPIRYPSISSKRISTLQVAKQYSLDPTEHKEQSRISDDIVRHTPLLAKGASQSVGLVSGGDEDGVDDEHHHATGSPTLKTLFSHVMVVSLISANKKKRTNIMSQLSGERTRARSTRHSLRTELRVARTTAVVVGVFIICWFPFSTIYVLQAYSLCVMPDCITNTMYVIAFWLGYSNSAVNPLLYAAFSRDFRAAFRKLLSRKQKGALHK